MDRLFGLFKYLCISSVITTVLLYACKPEEVVKNLRPPSIFDISPVQGEVNDTVRIKGKNFSTTLQENLVSFNGTPAEIISATSNLLTVKVMPGSRTGRVSLEVNGAKAIEPFDFFVFEGIAPIVKSFSPVRAKLDEEVIVEGENFGKNVEANRVTINGTICEVLEANTTKIRFRVTAGVSTGRITVTTGGRSGASSEPFEFIPTPPVITGIIHYSLGDIANTQIGVDEGDLLRITGRNFSNNPIIANVVRFQKAGGGEVASSPLAGDTLNIVVRVPPGAISGPVTISTFGQLGNFQPSIRIKTRDTWKKKRIPPLESVGAGVLGFYTWKVDRKVYAMYKRLESFQGAIELWQYDLDTDRWERRRSFGVTNSGGSPDPDATPRTGAATFVVNGKCYLVGGRSQSTLIDVWEYDPGTDLWVRKQDFVPQGAPASIIDNITYSFRLFFARGFTLGQGTDQRGYIGFNEGNRQNGNNWPGNRNALERGRMWKYNPAADKNYNPKDNFGISRAWEEIGSPLNPAVPASIITNLNTKIFTDIAVVSGKIYIVGIEYSKGPKRRNETGLFEDQILLEGTFSENNPTWVQKETDLPGNMQFARTGMLIGVNDRLYYHPAECGSVPTGTESLFCEIDYTAPIAKRYKKAGYAGEETMTGTPLVFADERSGRIYMGIGSRGILPTLRNAECIYDESRRNDLWEYIPE